MKHILLMALFALAGCAGDTAVFRVVEYGAGIFSADAGGCAVHQSSRPAGDGAERYEFVYQGERCAVRAMSK